MSNLTSSSFKAAADKEEAFVLPPKQIRNDVSYSEVIVHLSKQ